MSGHRSSFPNLESERFLVAGGSLVNSQVGPRPKLDNYQLSQISDGLVDCLREESANMYRAPSLMLSINHRNRLSSNYHEEADHIVPYCSDGFVNKMMIGHFLPFENDHIFLDEPESGNQGPSIPPVIQTRRDYPLGATASKGLAASMVHSSSEHDMIARPIETGSIHESLVVPKINRISNQLTTTVTFGGSKNPALVSKFQNEFGIVKTHITIKSNFQNFGNFETPKMDRSVCLASPLDCPSKNKIFFPDLSVHYSQKNSQQQQLMQTQPPVMHRAAPNPVNVTPPMSRDCWVSVEGGSMTPPRGQSPAGPSGSVLKNFLVNFFTDTPFSESMCLFTPVESMILGSLFSRKYEQDFTRR